MRIIGLKIVSRISRSRKGARLSAAPQLLPQLRFVARALAPWCVAAGVLVSFAARAAYAPQTLDPPLSLLPDRLVTELASEAERLGLEPAMDVPLFQTSIAAGPHADGGLLSADDPVALPSSSFRLVSVGTQQLSPRRFSVRNNDDGDTTPGTSGDRTAHASGGASPEILLKLTLTSPDGMTPSGGRAIELASVTPAPLEPEILQAPSIAVAIAPEDAAKPGEASDEDVTAGDPDLAVTDDETLPARLPGQPDYAALISPKAAKRELKCLAEAIYFEGRSESEAGQVAIAQVILNRVKSPLYPNTICGVVYQNRHRHLACQFTFACEGKKLRITEPKPWRTAVRLAKAVLGGEEYDKEVAGATHYHATYVRPRWAKKLRRMDKIGTHIFYKLRPGQT